MPAIIGSPYYAAVDELFTGRDGTPLDITGQRTYVRHFRVIVKLKEMSELTVALAPGIPLLGSFYETPGLAEWDLLAVLVRINCRQEYNDDWKNWIVTCEYSTNVSLPGGIPGSIGSPNVSEGSQNQPETEYPELAWDFDVVDEAPLCDLDGFLYENSAHQAFVPAPKYPVAYPVLTITRNERSFNRATAARYAFSLNDEEFLQVPAQCVQCYPPQAKAQFRGRMGYWRVTYKLKFNIEVPKLDPDTFEPVIDPVTEEPVLEFRTWQPRIPDYGTGEWVPTKDAQGNENGGSIKLFMSAPNKTQKKMLNKRGQPAAPYFPGNGQPPRFRAYHLVFRQYRLTSFKDLLVKGLQ